MLASVQSEIDVRPLNRSAVVMPIPPRPHDGARFLAELWRSASIVQVEQDEEIVAQGDDAEFCYEVLSGSVRTVRLLEDGRRQVGEFLFAGDVLGCDAALDCQFAAEAVTAVTLRRHRLRAIEDEAARNLGFANGLRRHVALQIRAARARLVGLGRKTASERIASFLIEMRSRLRASSPGVIQLPMGRTDIADYLGLTIETVCRSLTEFRHAGVIGVERSRISILDAGRLARAGSDQLH